MLKFIFVCLLTYSTGIVISESMTMWECNYCHQQYVGNQPPRFTKCPAKDMKQTHWWIRK